MNHIHTVILGVAAVIIASGCTADTGGPAGPTKEEIAADVSLGRSGGKSDEVDYCERAGWYGDGVCDWFCPRTDHDCTDDECTIGVDSTCDDDESCIPGLCMAMDPSSCGPAVCAPRRTFCSRALCGPGTFCDEELEACVPVETDFCPRAFCAPGTICDEEEDRCVSIDECPGVLCALYCPYGFEDGEDGCPVCRCAEEPDLDLCEPVMCELYCEFGFETDARGCEFCSCAEPPVDPEAACRRAGCSSQICIPADDPDVFTTCEFRPEYECIQQQTCEPQADGTCGFTDTEASRFCFDAL